jgi:hypothetical protein
MVTTQVLVPEQPLPDQPANAEPAVAVAVNVTVVPVGKSAEHVPGQLMPEGELVTVPEPAPARVTVNAFFVDGVSAASMCRIVVSTITDSASAAPNDDLPL